MEETQFVPHSTQSKRMTPPKNNMTLGDQSTLAAKTTSSIDEQTVPQVIANVPSSVVNSLMEGNVAPRVNAKVLSETEETKYTFPTKYYDLESSKPVTGYKTKRMMTPEGEKDVYCLNTTLESGKGEPIKYTDKPIFSNSGLSFDDLLPHFTFDRSNYYAARDSVLYKITAEATIGQRFNVHLALGDDSGRGIVNEAIDPEAPLLIMDSTHSPQIWVYLESEHPIEFIQTELSDFGQYIPTLQYQIKNIMQATSQLNPDIIVKCWPWKSKGFVLQHVIAETVAPGLYTPVQYCGQVSLRKNELSGEAGFISNGVKYPLAKVSNDASRVVIIFQTQQIDPTTIAEIYAEGGLETLQLKQAGPPQGADELEPMVFAKQFSYYRSGTYLGDIIKWQLDDFEPEVLVNVQESSSTVVFRHYPVGAILDDLTFIVDSNYTEFTPVEVLVPYSPLPKTRRRRRKANAHHQSAIEIVDAVTPVTSFLKDDTNKLDLGTSSMPGIVRYNAEFETEVGVPQIRLTPNGTQAYKGFVSIDFVPPNMDTSTFYPGLNNSYEMSYISETDIVNPPMFYLTERLPTGKPSVSIIGTFIDYGTPSSMSTIGVDISGTNGTVKRYTRSSLKTTKADAHHQAAAEAEAVASSGGGPSLGSQFVNETFIQPISDRVTEFDQKLRTKAVNALGLRTKEQRDAAKAEAAFEQHEVQDLNVAGSTTTTDSPDDRLYYEIFSKEFVTSKDENGNLVPVDETFEIDLPGTKLLRTSQSGFLWRFTHPSLRFEVTAVNGTAYAEFIQTDAEIENVDFTKGSPYRVGSSDLTFTPEWLYDFPRVKTNEGIRFIGKMFSTGPAKLVIRCNPTNVEVGSYRGGDRRETTV